MMLLPVFIPQRKAEATGGFFKKATLMKNLSKGTARNDHNLSRNYKKTQVAEKKKNGHFTSYFLLFCLVEVKSHIPLLCDNANNLKKREFEGQLKATRTSAKAINKK